MSRETLENREMPKNGDTLDDLKDRDILDDPNELEALRNGSTVPLAPISRTKPMNQGGVGKGRIALCGDVVCEGQHDSYHIQVDKPIGIGGESQLFLAIRQSDGAEVVAKFYDCFQDVPLNWKNRRRVIEFLQINNDFHQSHIMPLHDYGMVSVSEEGIDYRKPVDILPLCVNGTLGEYDKLSYSFLRETVIPQIHKALSLLHDANLIHRDVKPGNLYLLDGVVVLSDFGTVCEIVDEAEQFYGTRLKRGTLGYTAPEVWMGYASVSSDYYSLGCTIAALFKGRHVYQKLIDLNDESGVNRAINASGLPLGCREEEIALQHLVNALVLYDESKRAARDDVALWLRDPIVFHKKFSDRTERTVEERPFAFHFEDHVLTSTTELIEALTEDWETAKDYLYSGGIRNSPIINFFSKHNQALSMKAGRIIEEDEDTTLNYDLGLARFLYHLSEGGPIFWMGRSYTSLSDIAQRIHDEPEVRPQIESMLRDRLISWRLKQMNDFADETAEHISMLEDLAETDPEMACFYTMFLLSEDPQTYARYGGARDADGVFAYYTQSNDSFYRYCYELLTDTEAQAYLAFIGYREALLHLKSCTDNTFLENIEMIYRFFESVCSDKEAIRSHYYASGPQSYLPWLQRNLTLYSPHTSAAKELLNNMARVPIDSSAAIDEQARQFLKLKEYLRTFQRYFQGNPILASLGMNAGREIVVAEIRAELLDGFFVADFFGTPVPVGFLREVGISFILPELETTDVSLVG